MADDKKSGKKIAVVRVRGRVNVNREIESTLNHLNLTRTNHCVVIDDNVSIRGMLKKASNYITWGEISEPVFASLIEKKYPEAKKSAKDIFSGKTSFMDAGIKNVFALAPPAGGYKSTKKSFKSGGSLGDRGEKINELIGRMVR